MAYPTAAAIQSIPKQSQNISITNETSVSRHLTDHLHKPVCYCASLPKQISKLHSSTMRLGIEKILISVFTRLLTSVCKGDRCNIILLNISHTNKHCMCITSFISLVTRISKQMGTITSYNHHLFNVLILPSHTSNII